MFISILSWLRQNPIVNVGLVLVYYLLVVLPHNDFGAWVAKTFDEPLGRDTYNSIVLALGSFGLIFYVYSIWNGLFKHLGNHSGISLRKYRQRISLYFLWTIILVIIAVNTILVINVEMIHLVQYAIFALLLFPLLQHYSATLFWVTLFGAVDEAYQYKILSPTYAYYDFNDIILDLLGGALGLILIAAYRPFLYLKRAAIAKASILWTTVFLMLIIALAYYFNYLAIYPEKGIAEAPFQLIRKYKPDFWQEIHSATTTKTVIYHVVQPLEGVLLIVGLLLSYVPLGNFARAVKGQ